MKTIVRGVMIVGMALAPISAEAYEPSYDNLYHAYLKLGGIFDPETHMDSYLQTFHANIWQQYQHDEFSLEEKKHEVSEIMKEKINALDLEEVFTITLRESFGKYDFDREKYSFAPIGKSSYFPIGNGFGKLPRQIKLTFENSEIIDGIEMDKEKAKNFLKKRKQYGNVDRNVYIEVNFHVVDKENDGTLVGRIESSKIYADQNLNQVLQEIKADLAQ